jgi:hypothetical protein
MIDKVHEIEIDLTIWGSPKIYVYDKSGYVLQTVNPKREEDAYDIANEMWNQWKIELEKEKNGNKDNEAK